MHGDNGSSQPPRSLRTNRMEALSDGVMGFAMTLLVVGIAVQPPGTPLQQLLRAWPSLLAYVLSFMTIGAAWIAHSALTDRFERTDPIFLRLNLLTLLVVVFLPFPTGLVADAVRSNEGEREAVTLYGLTLMAIRLMGFVLVAYARHENLYPQDAGDEELKRAQQNPLPVVIGYVVALLIGLAWPTAAGVVYFGIAVVLVVPFRAVARVVFEHA